MRILILSQYFYPEIGATQIRMYEFARFLAANGHQVTVICEFPNHPHGRIPPRYKGRIFESESRDGFRIIRVWVWASPAKTFLNRLLTYNSFLALSIIRCLSVDKPDVVLATSPPLFVGLTGWIVSIFHRAHFALDIRDIWPAAAVALGQLRNTVAISLAERLERFLYRRSNLITVVTKGWCDYVRGIEKVQPERVRWIPNGTLPDHFGPVESDKLRSLLGLENKFIVAFAGNLGLAQDLDVVIEAAHRSTDDDSIAFVLIGAGPRKKELQELVRERKIANVYFVDQVSMDQVVPLLASADALLVSLNVSTHWIFESWIPVKLFDYLACAKPVILGVNGEAAEILEKSGGGIRFQAGKFESLLEAIRFLKANPHQAREMGRQGRDYVSQHFDRRSSAEHLETALRQIVSGDLRKRPQSN